MSEHQSMTLTPLHIRAILTRGGVRQFGAKYIAGGNPVW